jgi:hypothetical protein
MNRLTVRASAFTGSGPADLAHPTSPSRLSVHAERPVHEPLVHNIQFTCPQPDINKVPARNHTNDQPGQTNAADSSRS